LARYWPDGRIEFLGRVNSQVKLNGYRIELGEIEAALNSCPGVKASVVTVLAYAVRSTATGGFVVPGAHRHHGATVGHACASPAAASQLPGDTDRDALARFQQQSEALAPLLILHNLIQLKLCAGQGQYSRLQPCWTITLSSNGTRRCWRHGCRYFATSTVGSAGRAQRRSPAVFHPATCCKPL
jgi:hypothetical protein